MRLLVVFLILAASVNAEPRKAKCEMNNVPITYIDFYTKKEKDVDNFIVHCVAKNPDGKVLKEETLPLAQPTPYPEASAAAYDWVKKNGN